MQPLRPDLYVWRMCGLDFNKVYGPNQQSHRFKNVQAEQRVSFPSVTSDKPFFLFTENTWEKIHLYIWLLQAGVQRDRQAEGR